jgi:hypothetical protein
MLWRLSVVFGLVFVLYAPDAQAFGGNDAEPGNKISAATQKCATALGRASALYAFKRAKAINLCLDGILKCDEQSNEEKADNCRRKLIQRGSGKCAVGKLDNGLSTLGSGAADDAVFFWDTTSLLDKELRKFVDAVQKRCYDVPEVDLTNAGTGLFFEVFGNPPPNSHSMVDFLNSTAGNPGAGCFGNHLSRRAYPLADALISSLGAFNWKCALPKDEATYNTPCLNNGECGSSGRGKCGRVAKALEEGNPGGVPSSPMMLACTPLP